MDKATIASRVAAGAQRHVLRIYAMSTSGDEIRTYDSRLLGMYVGYVTSRT